MATIKFYMVSVQESGTTKNTAANGTNNAAGFSHGFCDASKKDALKNSQSAIVLFSERTAKIGAVPEIDSYILRVGKKTAYDHRDGIQIVSPRALQLILLRLEEDKQMSGKVTLFLNPGTKDLVVRHSDDRQAVDRVSDAGDTLKAVSKANVVNRIESNGLGKAGSDGVLSAFGLVSGVSGLPSLGQGQQNLEDDGFEGQEQMRFDF